MLLASGSTPTEAHMRWNCARNSGDCWISERCFSANVSRLLLNCASLAAVLCASDSAAAAPSARKWAACVCDACRPATPGRRRMAGSDQRGAGQEGARAERRVQ